MQKDTIALYTTIYPGVEKYLTKWYESVLTQTDKNFDLWIGVDSVDIQSIISAFGKDPGATWVFAEKGSSPSEVRQRAICKIVKEYSAIIFVDSDDILHPTRIEAARKSLGESDISGCALSLISADGKDLGLIFKPSRDDFTNLLTRNNVFGLSNTIYKSEVLSQCLPIPSDCLIVDWYLATRAMLIGARLGFDMICRMSYRQHPNNIAHILPPFTMNEIISSTQMVLNHYSLILENNKEFNENKIFQDIYHADNYVKMFQNAIIKSRIKLYNYVNALNKLPISHIWWSCVAHRDLEEIWRN